MRQALLRFHHTDSLMTNWTDTSGTAFDITVEVNGSVSSVILVEDSLASGSVSSCVLAQMQGWKSPAIAEGVVTFKTPFVFTPPE